MRRTDLVVSNNQYHPTVFSYDFLLQIEDSKPFSKQTQNFNSSNLILITVSFVTQYLSIQLFPIICLRSSLRWFTIEHYCTSRFLDIQNYPHPFMHRNFVATFLGSPVRHTYYTLFLIEGDFLLPLLQMYGQSQ